MKTTISNRVEFQLCRTEYVFSESDKIGLRLIAEAMAATGAK